MKVGLGIPFGSHDQSRIDAFYTALPRIGELYPFDKSIAAAIVDDSGRFNRAASRNEVFRQLTDMDVVVCCDADSIPEKEPLEVAIETASASNTICFPFDVVKNLSRGATLSLRDPLVPLSEVRVLNSYGPSAGGVYVTRPEVWWSCGGMDENLGGWGTDDRSFLVCINTFSEKVYVEGSLYCLWHSRGASCQVDPDQQQILEQYYLPFEGNQQALREYLDFRGYFTPIGDSDGGVNDPGADKEPSRERETTPTSLPGDEYR